MQARISNQNFLNNSCGIDGLNLLAKLQKYVFQVVYLEAAQAMILQNISNHFEFEQARKIQVMLSRLLKIALVRKKAELS